MKKILLALTLLSIPLTAHAETQKTISDDAVQAAINEFKPSFCKDGWKGIADSMTNCYEKTNLKDPKIHQCILADIATQYTVQEIDNKKTALGKDPIWLESHSQFLSSLKFNRRIKYYIKPTFEKQDLEDIRPAAYYHDEAIDKFNNALKNCN